MSYSLELQYGSPTETQWHRQREIGVEPNVDLLASARVKVVARDQILANAPNQETGKFFGKVGRANAG
jgi:hypothetical protein